MDGRFESRYLALDLLLLMLKPCEGLPEGLTDIEGHFVRLLNERV
jgi:hypothetical protein